MANQAFGDWFAEQSSERQEAAMDHMRVCIAYGLAQREAPQSTETEELRRQIVAYYEKWGK